MNASVATILICTLALTACDDAKKAASAGSATATTSATAAPAKPSAQPAATASAEGDVVDGPKLVIVPMKFVSTDPKKPGVAVELGEDGTMRAGEEVLGQFVKNYFEDVNGNIVFSVDNVGHVIGKGINRRTIFDVEDELIVENGKGKIVVDDDGSITMTENGKSEKLPVKIGGFKKEGRRVAVLMTAFATLQKPSPPAATSAKPPSPPTKAKPR